MRKYSQSPTPVIPLFLQTFILLKLPFIISNVWFIVLIIRDDPFSMNKVYEFIKFQRINDNMDHLWNKYRSTFQ